MSYKRGLIVAIEKFNRFNNKGEKTGVWKEFHKNETVKEEGPFYNNLKHGVFRIYNQRGNLQDIILYEFVIKINNDTELNETEVIRTFDENGKIEYRGKWAKQERDLMKQQGYNNGDKISGKMFPQLWSK